MIEIQLNGQAYQLATGGSVGDLMAALALPDQALAVAVNRQVVPRQSWDQHQLQAQDQVDVVRAIGGG